MKKNSLTILFEDDDIVIVSKPSGLLSIPDRFKKDEPNVRRILEEKYGRIFVVHRLDRDTSGVMVFARTAAAHRHLSMQFEHHTIEKKYLAIVAGTVPKESIDIDIPLMPNPRVPGTMMPSARGKESHTTVRVLERFRVATYVECLLKTGRQHQLRVHCAAIGYPLLIDATYGRAAEFKLSQIKRRYRLQKDTEEQPIMARTTLHAHSLSFIHPSSLQPCTFVSDPPKDFKALLTVLRKYSAALSSVTALLDDQQDS
ncbi:MAG: hypothetical protein RL156_852 [Bacteroidota bacterium]